MKNASLLFVIIFTILSCNNQKKANNRNITINDTLTTSSGLKYIFLKEGKGRKIDIGSKVKAYTDLYQNDYDSIIWSTSNEEDSIFSFIHGKTSLVKGFSELNNYLVEGDEVIAIIPDSLGYGKGGGNGVPPGATLIYNPYIVKHVSEPKKVLSDTLYAITSSENAKVAINFYEKVVRGELKNYYHTDVDLMFGLLKKLNKDSLYTKSQHLAEYFIKKTEEDYFQEGFKYYKILALEGQGKFNEAIVLAESLAKQEGDQEYWKTMVMELKEKLNNQ